MRVLALDLSLTQTGWAILEGDRLGPDLPLLVQHGCFGLEKPIREHGTGRYPNSYMEAARTLAAKILFTAGALAPEKIVVEETNGARNRFVQKALEFMHFAFLDTCVLWDVQYVSTSDWRRILGIRLSKGDKHTNAALRRAARAGRLDAKRKELGVKGRVTPKHVAVRWLAEQYGVQLPQGRNDEAEAVAVGVAWFKGAPVSDGEFVKKKRVNEKIQ